MGFKRVLKCFATCSLVLTPTVSAITYGFPYGSQKVRGVNLGGWLVLEVRWL